MAKIAVLLLNVAFWSLGSKVVLAESSLEYAAMGRSAWSAFECSVLAEKSKNQAEQERLFNFGYSQGLKFIGAIQENKIKEEDLSKEVPIAMILLLEGPTPDFMLGRIFDSALEHVLRDVYKTDDEFHSPEVLETIAKNKYWNKNCRLIGY